MPKDTYKSAAVPFVNQKGERSMKKVKVERYVAGKKPTYANDEDEEYYTTDEEEGGYDCEEQSSEEDQSDREKEYNDNIKDNGGLEKIQPRYSFSPQAIDCGDDEEEEDDPRFKRLKLLEAIPNSSQLLNAQTSTVGSKIEDKTAVIDDEEDEEEIRLRHSIARARTLEKPIGLQIAYNDLFDQQESKQDVHILRKLETEDILEDLKLTGIKSKEEIMKEEEAKLQKSLAQMLEQAKQEAAFKAQVMRKVEEDNKREIEKETLDKNDFTAYEMAAVKTDDEDEELAYEEWRLREIKRVQRDRSERSLS